MTRDHAIRARAVRLSPDEVAARARAQGRTPAIRFHGRNARITFVDELHGPLDPFGEAGLDDFVLRRADGVAAYQLAVVVDDAAMQIGEVVRGHDLLLSTPRQLALYAALNLKPPRFAHVPLLLTPQGERLAKRTRPTPLGDLRARGLSAAEIIGRLATSAGLPPPPQRPKPSSKDSPPPGPTSPPTPKPGPTSPMPSPVIRQIEPCLRQACPHPGSPASGRGLIGPHPPILNPPLSTSFRSANAPHH